AINTALLKPRVFRPIIRSVVQTVNPPFNSRLLYLQQPKNFQRSADVVGRAQLVQKWAYLRLLNESVAAVIENLALRFGNLRRDFNAMIDAMEALQNSFQSPSSGDYRSPGGSISSCYPKPQSALSNIIVFANTFRQEICQLVRSEHLLLQAARPLCVNLQIYGFIQQPSNISGSKHTFTSPTLSAPAEDTRTDSFIHSLASETAANLQLYIIHLLFVEFNFHLPITEVLRRQLRTLSAVNMKLLHQTSVRGEVSEAAYVDCTSCEKMELGAQPLRGSCRTVKRTFNITYHKPHLEKLGETIATCTQRLEAFMKDLTVTRQANLQLLRSFPQPSLPLFSVSPGR
ncbi:unnamed protein product, partial [Schistocephalus solidus]|uniref:Coiled-coil domain-containing protein 142 n=1 Tax=Schistocephalus solidus TaxID=70667 RepID=A0A183TA60_SCHSO